MLHLFTGTDREKARAAMDAAIKKTAKKGTRIVRVSDASSVADLEAALAGGGMFDDSRVVVLSGTLGSDEMREIVLRSLEKMRGASDTFFFFEEKPDADTRKKVEKYAEKSERFDLPAKKRESNIFAIANALRKGDKKMLWVNYQREIAGDAAPEAIHGVLFWGAKDMLMKSRGENEKERAKKLIARLAELPHEARRHGEELEYALERFLLSGV